jgi:hypothetical protein
MSDEQFLARWSRRKREAKADHSEPAVEEQAADTHGSAPSDHAAAEPVPCEVELSNLPPIESIEATTDITAFLRKGVPQELSRAALRRAWSADPAIRDFVGLAENAWNFNDPNAMGGFGPLDYSAEQVDGFVRRIVGGVVQTAESITDAPAESAAGAAELAPAQEVLARSSHPEKAITEPRPREESASMEMPSNSAAPQPRAAGEDAPLRRRTHGRALPQ